MLEANRGRPLAEQPVAVIRGTLDWLVPQVWRTRARAEEQVVLRVGSAQAAVEAARAGIGVVFLPCYLGDPLPDLHRVTPPFEHLTLELWVLTHPALRHTARVKVLMRYLTDALLQRASLFDGTSSLAPRA